ncbi:hypothetical protein [Marinomonas algarum]|uniref:KfrA N-terminal DNA-binding domain-containing protein n=1 Tax=Marinomonas algarum TaxID=2883105 RepID=A0A9X1LB27_9GAMM|nr:hypothetical protein [Marinomonas algarum]MCB5160334.1 hypothetical protein [Marinomonas algarum]
MARKANISKEEIHQACWSLIEDNCFPNIPRLADFFLKKDGRRCSNTTLLNAVTEWEEQYKEQQQNQLTFLDEDLSPIFKRFSREVTQCFGQLLDEKTAEILQQNTVKQGSIDGGYLSLSEDIIALQGSNDVLSKNCTQLEEQVATLKQQLAIAEHHVSRAQQQAEDVLTQNKVVTYQLSQEQENNTELQLNLSQKEVELAKQDTQLQQLRNENTRLNESIQQLRYEKENKQQESWQVISEKIEALSASVKTMQLKDRDD